MHLEEKKFYKSGNKLPLLAVKIEIWAQNIDPYVDCLCFLRIKIIKKNKL